MLIANLFKKTPEDLLEIILLCKKYNIKITGSLFNNSINDIKTNIEYIKNNYGDKYLTSLILSVSINHLKTIFPYLKELGVLEIVINSSSILTLTLDEIKERMEYIESINEEIVVEDKFNSIFGLSKKNYLLRKEKLLKKN